MDERTPLEKWMWDAIGPPLYYCGECMRVVRVKPVEGKEPNVLRVCKHENAPIIAPRKAVMVGKGGMSVPTKAKVSLSQFGSWITGRSV